MFTNLPLFPSTCDVWSGLFADASYNLGHFSGPPRLSGIKCEIVAMVHYMPGAFSNPVTNSNYVNLGENDSIGVLIYFPKGTDIRPWSDGSSGQDSLKVDGVWHYTVNDTFPVACGFPGEFLAAYCVKAGF
jgi:hypothetical protein